MSNSDSIVLEGTTLGVYVYIAKEHKPIGPRDVMRGLHLNSPSVAYRHLQKLEDSGVLAKNEYGEYFLNRKAKVKGYHCLLHRAAEYSYRKYWLSGWAVPEFPL